VKGFAPPSWARNPHCQTLLGAWGWRRHEPLTRERVALPDGDFVDLDWLSDAPGDGPLLLILHGLEGSSASPYVGRLLKTCRDARWRAVVMNFRGCSGEPNRLARSYHCGETGDLDSVIRHLRSRNPQGLCAVGYSLGGAVLLNWLGEQRTAAGLLAAAAISVPFDLEGAAERLNRGFSRLYQWALLRQLRRSLSRKASCHGHPPPPLRSLTTFRAFDDAITAPLHGFANAGDYYRRASCRPHLRHIAVPTLLIQAADDPFLMPTNPLRPDELSPPMRLELSAFGGHVGFIEGGSPLVPRSWLEPRLARFFGAYLSR